MRSPHSPCRPCQNAARPAPVILLRPFHKHPLQTPGASTTEVLERLKAGNRLFLQTVSLSLASQSIPAMPISTVL